MVTVAPAGGAVLEGMVNPQGASGQTVSYWGTDPNLNTYNVPCL
jgi:hypothetical protein